MDRLTLGLSRRFVRRSYRTPLFLARLAAAARVYERGFTTGIDAVLTPVLTHTTPRIGYLTPDQDPDVLLDKLSSYVGFTRCTTPPVRQRYRCRSAKTPTACPSE